MFNYLKNKPHQRTQGQKFSGTKQSEQKEEQASAPGHGHHLQ
jgi:hypothetical protein